MRKSQRTSSQTCKKSKGNRSDGYIGSQSTKTGTALLQMLGTQNKTHM
jgi:hypothetical protein